MDINERNLKIISLSENGISTKDIAKEFKLTKNRIDQIVSRHKTEKEISEKSKKLTNQIKQSNNMDKKWPVIDLINILHLSSRSSGLMIKYFSSENKIEISLNESVSSLTPRDIDSKYTLYSIPIMKQKQLGKKLYREIINRLSIVDFGEAFNVLWQDRKKLILFRFK